MSAFVVNKSHINAMIQAALHLKYGGRGLSWYHNGQHSELQGGNNEDAIGQMLLDECINSVSHRYDDGNLTNLPGRTDAEYIIPFKYHFTHRIPKPLEAISITKCYMYQSCEHPEWETSEAKAFCDALIDTKIAELPGYEDAPWQWEDEEYYKAQDIVRLV